MDDFKTKNALLFKKKREEWIAEFCKFITDYTREIFPESLTVSHNNAYEVAGDWHETVWEGISDQCDYCTGDLYGDIYDHSFCMKFYQSATKNMPFEYMVSRFSKNLQQHTLSKTQTDHAGVDIYTHGEMLPAHYYPALKKFQHLYGNYGSSWFRQNEDFASFNGPVILTTNCIIPVQSSYQDRIFTTGTAGYPNIPHIPDGSPKDFGAVIELAKTCPLPRQLENSLIHGGVPDLTGIAEDIRAGRIRRIVVMAGCDGRHRTRDYYTRVAEALPDDVLVVTAGCAKFRFLKLSRKNIIDAGQCNDSYRIVTMLKTLNDLTGIRVPVSFDLAWYEQKAVAVLLALLALGYRKIRLGPTLPAFLSPGVMKVLVENFALKGIGDPARDVAAMLNGC